MNTRVLLVFGLLLAGSVVHAKPGNLQRGGLGFLFPDHNSFENPGQFSISHGMAIEANYQRTNQDGGPQTAGPSLVYGNGKVGFGAFGARFGTDLGNSATSVDVAGAGLGFALMKERLTIGVSALRQLETVRSNDALVRGTITFNGAQRKGPSIGIAYDKEIGGAQSSSGRIGLGYSFRSNASMELNVLFNDLNDFNNWVAAGFFNIGGGAFYMGAGYRYHKAAQNHEALARLGVVLGSAVDFSLTASHMFQSGAAVNYGGTFRASF